MPASSSQTLTFLFTDLEGSTRLWEEHPDAMRAALAQHDGLLRDAIERQDGSVVKSTGDGLLATFASAHDGVTAAADGQRALLAATWPDGISLRVRMGLHVGEATERDGDWFGSDVNRAARVMAAAHGGQILCTAPVADHVRDSIGLLDLGEHRLRDLQSEVRLFQVARDGLPVAFPPLRTLDAYRCNLPYELSSFVGRDAEIRAVTDRVRAARLVSIVGVGGVGKTRLAIQVASEVLPHFADGVWLCELAAVLDPDDIPDAVAASLGYAPPQGVTVRDGLPRFLERKELLLVLDNCEHLVNAVARFVTETTASAANISVLATSREALGVRGEHAYPLPSLEVPGTADAVTVLASEAGALFVARAEEARGDLALGETEAHAVRELCERLDGIPLAIELAAAQTKVMTVNEVLTRLDKQFRLLTGGRRASLERHQTLRAAIDWSYELLSDEERALFTRLSVCVGGFDLDAAAALAAGIGRDEFDAFEILASLVSKSLVERTERAGTTRYRLLEMIRQFAAEQLAAAPFEGTRDDHARHYLALATQLFGEASTAPTYEPLERLELETPNIGAAARWTLLSHGVEAVMTFFENLPYLDPFSVPVSTVDELGAVAAEAIEHPAAHHLPGLPNACYIAGYNLFFSGDRPGFRALGHRAVASDHGPNSAPVAVMVGTAALFDGDLPAVVAQAEKSVGCARAGDVSELTWMLANLASMRSLVEPVPAHADAEEALAAARRTGGIIIRLYPLLTLATAARRVAPSRALEAAEELIEIDQTRRRIYATVARSQAAEIQVAQGAIAEGLTRWVDVFHALEVDGERTLFTLSVSSLAGAVEPFDRRSAIELGAIAESRAVAHFAAFTAQPALVRLAEERPDEVALALERADALSYDDAVATVFALLDRLIAEHGGPDA